MIVLNSGFDLRRCLRASADVCPVACLPTGRKCGVVSTCTLQSVVGESGVRCAAPKEEIRCLSPGGCCRTPDRHGSDGNELWPSPDAPLRRRNKPPRRGPARLGSLARICSSGSTVVSLFLERVEMTSFSAMLPAKALYYVTGESAQIYDVAVVAFRCETALSGTLSAGRQKKRDLYSDILTTSAALSSVRRRRPSSMYATRCCPRNAFLCGSAATFDEPCPKLWIPDVGYAGCVTRASENKAAPQQQ